MKYEFFHFEIEEALKTGDINAIAYYLEGKAVEIKEVWEILRSCSVNEDNRKKIEHFLGWYDRKKVRDKLLSMDEY